MPIDSAEKTAEAHAERALKSRVKNASRKTGRTKKPRVPKLHRPKRESTKTIVARLYRTWSAIVHARTDGRCEVCGAEGKNDAHHVQPRQVCSGLRFDPRNGVCLCPSHHKFGRQSAHKGMLWFADWFRKNRPGDYGHVMENLDLELDCRDRLKLYAVESDLHDRYGDAIAPLPAYDVVAYDRKGNKVQSVVQAHNNRAAEFVFWNNWPKTEIPLKGIHKTTEVTHACPEKAAEMKRDLIGRGLMDEDGNAINTRQLPKSTDAAAIAIVQTYGK